MSATTTQRPFSHQKARSREGLFSLSSTVIGERGRASGTTANGSLPPRPRAGPTVEQAMSTSAPFPQRLPFDLPAAAATTVSTSLPRVQTAPANPDVRSRNVGTAGSRRRPPRTGGEPHDATPSHSIGGDGMSSSLPPAASAAVAGTQPRRPASQQHRRPQPRAPPTPNGSTLRSRQGSDFHRGLVSALHGVLRQQRQGVFPAVGAGTTGSGPTTTAGGSSLNDTVMSEREIDHVPAGPPWGSSSSPLGTTGGRPSVSRGSLRASRMNTPLPSQQHQPASASIVVDRMSVHLCDELVRAEGQRRDALRMMQESSWVRILNDETREAVEVAAKRQSPAPCPARSNVSLGAAATSSTATNSAPSGVIEAPLPGRSYVSDAASLKAEGNGHYQRKQFADAYRCYSMAIELDPTNAVLLTNRAAVCTMLLLYDACVRDCVRATELDTNSWKAFARMARAYALLGQLSVAARHYTTAVLILGGSSTVTVSEADKAPLDDLVAERAELQHLQQAKTHAESREHASAVKQYMKAVHFVDEPPVRLQLHRSNIHVDAEATRSDLMRYLTVLPSPTSLTGVYATSPKVPGRPRHNKRHFTTLGGPGQQATLHANVVAHYCDVLRMASKACLFCGVAYLNLAASHAQRCLELQPNDAAACRLVDMLTGYEDRLAAASESFEANEYSAAVEACCEALRAIHDGNTKLRASVLVLRAEAHLRLEAHEQAKADSSAVLEQDARCLKALVIRAKAHEGCGDYGRALSDADLAATINEDLVEDLVALRFRMQQHHTRQQQQQQEQESRQREDTRKHFFRGAPRPRQPSANSRQQQQHRRNSRESDSEESESSSSASAAPERFNGGLTGSPTYYEVLGVARSASAASIRAAYRKLTLQLHPDKVVSETQERRRACEQRFKEVGHAYSVLGDPPSRAQYDRTFLF